MSKSAGTLITTHAADYIPPRFMPGHDGHIPTMKFDFGETYGNHGAKYFQDYRFHTLDSSRTNMCSGGMFPTFYSCSPNIAVETRARKWDRWLLAPHYRLYHQDHDKREQLIAFSKKCLAHREHYSDKSGTVPHVDFFLVPTPAEEQFNSHKPFILRSFRYTDDINMPNWDHQIHLIQRKPHVSLHKSTHEERTWRDKYFENRAGWY